MNKIRVRMYPSLAEVANCRSGICTVIRAYHKVSGKAGIEFVDSADHELTMVHAGMGGNKSLREGCDISMLHGIYFSGEYNAPKWERAANAKIVNDALFALSVTVPSGWVADTFRREFKIDPYIIDHGVFWKEWQHNRKYNPKQVFWGKNRIFEDVCDPTPLNLIAARMPDFKFVTTLADVDAPKNVIPMGLLDESDIKRIVQESAVVLSTIRETWGILYIESMAAGTPVVTINAGHVPNLSPHGISGYSYRPGDVSDMERGILWALKYRDILSTNARQLAKKYTWESAIKTLRKVLDITLEKKRYYE